MFKQLFEARKSLKSAILDYKKFKEIIGTDAEVSDFDSTTIFIKKDGKRCQVWGDANKTKFVLDKEKMKDSRLFDLIKEAMKASITYKQEAIVECRMINREK